MHATCRTANPPQGIMLSGGPNSVFADGAPGIDSVKKLKNKKNSFIFSPLAPGGGIMIYYAPFIHRKGNRKDG